MTVLKIEPGKFPVVTEIDNNLKSLQESVGDTIQVIYPFDEPIGLIANDDGKLLGLPLNRALCDENGAVYDIIAGVFLIVGLSDDDFCDLTQEQAEKYGTIFKYPEQFINYNDQIIVLKEVTENV